MAHSLNLRVVAEGVESKEQSAFFHTQEIHGMQGNLFSAPLPADSMAGLLRDGLTIDDLWGEFARNALSV